MQHGDDRPNACNLCHLDRSLRWTAEKLAAWYKRPIAPGLDDTPAGARWLLSGDAILRAIAAWQYGAPGARAATKIDAQVPLLVAALSDPYSAVRFVAARALRSLDAANAFDYLAPVDDRERAAAAILRRWQAQHGGSDDAAALITRLKSVRDDTPVRALE
jgi:hypothetical protein